MYDTFSITMELERPLLYNEEDYTEKKREEERQNKDVKSIKKALFALLFVLTVFIIGFFIWLSNGYSLQSYDLKYLESNSKVEVKTDGD